MYALCANEHVMVTECKFPTNNTYIHTRHEIFSADTNDRKLFAPFSDPQKRCTQTVIRQVQNQGSGDVHVHMRCWIGQYLHGAVAIHHCYSS